MDEILIGAPDSLCALSLARRFSGVRAVVEPADAECAVRVHAPATAFGNVLRTVHTWLGDYELEAVPVHVGGRLYRLEHDRGRSAHESRDPDELPEDIELDV